MNQPRVAGSYERIKFKEMLDKEPGLRYICFPIDHFWTDGPNGSHLCIVYPVAGPRASRLFDIFPTGQRKIARTIAHRVVQAMAALHSHGICHGGWSSTYLLVRFLSLTHT